MSVSFFLFLWREVTFYEYFRTITVFSLYGEYVVRFPFRMVVFYLVTTGCWMFYICFFCEISTNQSINHSSIKRSGVGDSMYLTCYVCVLCVLTSHLFWTSGLWTYQPGPHYRRGVQDSSTFLLRCLPSFF